MYMYMYTVHVLYMCDTSNVQYMYYTSNVYVRVASQTYIFLWAWVCKTNISCLQHTLCVLQ